MSSSTHTVYVAEPPAIYQLRPSIVVDCSVFAAVIFDEDKREAAEEKIADRMLHAPLLLDFEIASVAWTKQTRGMDPELVQQALEDYMTHNVKLHRIKLSEQVTLAANYKLSAYDAAYLWLAAALKVPLVTFDRRLAEVARDHLGGLG